MRMRPGYAPVTRICGALHRTGRPCGLSPDRPHEFHLAEVPVVLDPSGVVEWSDPVEGDEGPADAGPDVCLAFVERRRARLRQRDS